MDKLEGHKFKDHIEKKYAEWLDNSNPDKLGIVTWSRELLPDYTTDATPDVHIMLYLLLLSLYNPSLVNKYERLRNFILFRECAKSTAVVKIFARYIMCHNGMTMKVRKVRPILNKEGLIIGLEYLDEIMECTIKESLIAIVSETSTPAEDAVTAIRNEFTENEALRYYYKFDIQDAVDSVTGEWTKKAFKMNKCYMIGLGTGMQIRGKIKGASRPSLLISDDLYSENNIGEVERPKIKKWFNDAAINSVDNKLGKAIVISTIVHEDTVPVQLKKNKLWKTIELPVMPIDEFNEFVQIALKTDYDTSTCDLPFDDELDDDIRRKKQIEYFDKLLIEKKWKLAWKERINLYLLALKYQDAVLNRNISGLYQEYFHKVISPQDKKFRKEMFGHISKWELQYKYGYNWIKIEDSNKWEVINIDLGIDRSTGEGKDDSAISPVGMLSDKRIIVFPIVFGKWSARDNLTNGDQRLEKVCTDRSIINSIGVMDETFRQALRYHPNMVKIGTAPSEKGVDKEFRRIFESNKLYDTMVITRPQTVREKEKSVRIKNTLLPYYETRMVFHCGQQEKLEYQLEYLGKADRDDIVDSLECGFWTLEAPPSIDFSFFEGDTSEVKVNTVESYDWKTHF